MSKGTKNDQFNQFWTVWCRPRADDDKTQKPVKRTYTDPNRAVNAAAKMAAASPSRKFFVLAAIARVRVVGEEMQWETIGGEWELELEGSEEI